MKHHHKGFTIIELLVVISIIGLLSAIASFALANARAQARDNRRIQDLQQIKTALELYFKDNKKYPKPARGYGNGQGIGTGSGHCFGFNGDPQWGNTNDYIEELEAQKYISDLPRDPRFDTNGNGVNVNPQCYVYQADNNTSEGHYKIVAFNVVESMCGTDLSDPCNPSYLQAMDDPRRTGAYMAIYDNTSRLW